ncbi:hypothetical protein L249_0465 [Ophiocordyceps polyrhachis-furcata BCC 54312]|uniref:Uncharacterized protein n=1 Tax=Ophiocordyceps polyrhachis-furcata BCC 54312 TaxID=1330021 RepID=A0A367LF19_9HYPO|nr:hypothetical protein L249_0465 [Ophiocordyceps polyrhachis-furcata BCC 54312]
MYASTLDAEHAASALMPMIHIMHLSVKTQPAHVAGHLPLLSTERSNFPIVATAKATTTFRGGFAVTLSVATAVRLRTLLQFMHNV